MTGPDGQLQIPIIPHLTDAERSASLSWINQLRAALGIGDYAMSKAGTISIASGGGHEALGLNATLSAAMLRLSPRQRRKIKDLMGLPEGTDARFVEHAELASLFLLRERIGGEMPRVVRLAVDRPTCPSCLANLGRVARYLGVEELHVHVVGAGTAPLVIRAN